MRVLKFLAVAVIVMAAKGAWAEEVTYDQGTGALTLVQDSTWATHTAATGLYDFEVYFAGTTANNSAVPHVQLSGRQWHGPCRHIAGYQRGRHFTGRPRQRRQWQRLVRHQLFRRRD